MEIILPKISSSLSKMWTKVLNLENSLFPSLKRELQLEELSNKEQKLIKILDFAAIEKISLSYLLQTLQSIEKRLHEHLLQRVFTISKQPETLSIDFIVIER